MEYCAIAQIDIYSRGEAQLLTPARVEADYSRMVPKTIMGTC